jgi:hypothetical protein
MYYKVRKFYYFTLSAFLMLALFVISKPAITTQETDTVRLAISTEITKVVLPVLKTANPVKALSFGWSISQDFYAAASVQAYGFFMSTDEGSRIGFAIDSFLGYNQNPRDYLASSNFQNSQTSFLQNKEKFKPFDTNVYILYNTLERSALEQSAERFSINAAGRIAGTSVGRQDLSLPPLTRWISVQDGITKEFYCLAIFSGEVNKYEGPCKQDHYE